jgi:predicted dehydrogenase
LKILIIGLGSIAKKHIKVLQELKNDIVIFALRSSSNSIDQEGVINIIDINNLPIIPDFIIISNPTKFHEDAIQRCIVFKVPLFIEKPVFDSVVNKVGVLNEIKENAIRTYIACNLRFHPAVIFLKQFLAINKQSINEVNIYCGSNLAEWRPGTDFRKSYSANKEFGGGVHLDLIHELDYAIWLFGLPSDTKSVKRTASTLGINSIDYASYQLIYPSFVASITLNYFRKNPKREIELILENNIITCDLLKCTVRDMDGNLLFEKNGFEMMDTYKDQMNYFLEKKDTDQEIMNNIEEAFNVLKIALLEEA